MKNQMKAIDLHARKLGDETPLLCTPLIGRTRESVLAEATTSIAQKPDMIAWRVGFFEQIGDTKAVIETAQGLRGLPGMLPIIFTCRSIKEGGEPIANRSRHRV
jgi:3-dehydroquinate dehydratase I